MRRRGDRHPALRLSRRGIRQPDLVAVRVLRGGAARPARRARIAIFVRRSRVWQPAAPGRASGRSGGRRGRSRAPSRSSEARHGGCQSCAHGRQEPDVLRDGRAFIMYGRQGRPGSRCSIRSGPSRCVAGADLAFVEAARAAGCRPVFYQISPAGCCPITPMRACAPSSSANWRGPISRPSS